MEASPRSEERGDDMQQSLTALPAEILNHILMWLDPESVMTASKVCRVLYHFIKGNQSLCRDVYLLWMDKPDVMDLDWEAELHDLVKLRRIFSPDRDQDKEIHQLAFVCDTVSRLLKNSSYVNNNEGNLISNNAEYLRDLFSNELAASTFLQQSSLFERMRSTAYLSARGAHPPREEHQMSAKLHCLYGSPILKAGRTRSARSYPYACSRVYDLRQYTQRTKWGPFRDDDTGRVDWEKVEAIAIVLGKNMLTKWPRADVFDEIWDTPFHGSFPRSFVPRKMPELGDLDARDPYGVTGSWYRVVCFLDYSDFFHYNFSMGALVPSYAPRPPLNVGEATRLIIMKIRVTSIEPPGPDDGQELPVVHFEGESQSIDNSMDDNANSDLRGSVRLTPEGEVRWTSVSIFHGQERWRSEGIQVGGVRSARGVVGTWFDRDYDLQGPAGPTAFWKAADAENPRDALLDSMTGILAMPAEFPHALTDMAASSGDEMEFLDDDDADDDDDVGDEEAEFGDLWDGDLEPTTNELLGLLEDAEMDLAEVTPHEPSV